MIHRVLTFLVALLFATAAHAHSVEETIEERVAASERALSAYIDQRIPEVLDDTRPRVLRIWQAEDYAAGSRTGGIVEALDACESGGGGEVWFDDVEIDARGMQAPLLETPRVESHNTAWSPCHLFGHGSVGTLNYVTAQDPRNAELAKIGSTITVHNACEMIPNRFGERAVMAIRAEGFRAADWAMRVGCTDKHVRGIVAQVPGGNDTLADVTLERVVVAGDVTIGISPEGSIGLDLQATMRSRIIGGRFRNWGTGIEFGNTPFDDALKNNANVLQSVNVTSNYVGLAFRTWHACSSVTVNDLNAESNQYGVVFEDNAGCRALFNGGDLEQVAPHGVANIVNRTAGSRVILINTEMGGTPNYRRNERGVWQRQADSWDYIRERHRGVVQATGFGLDLFIGVHSKNGIWAQGGFVQIMEPYYIERARGYVGAGDTLYHPDDCDRHVRVAGSSVQGRKCIQLDDLSERVTKPVVGLGREGIADMPGEVACVANCAEPVQP